MLPAALVGDLYMSVPVLLLPGMISGPGTVKVMIMGRPVATVGTPCSWLFFIPDSIVVGSAKVMIEGRPAARIGSVTALGGLVFFPNLKVMIGG